MNPRKGDNRSGLPNQKYWRQALVTLTDAEATMLRAFCESQNRDKQTVFRGLLVAALSQGEEAATKLLTSVSLPPLRPKQKG